MDIKAFLEQYGTVLIITAAALIVLCGVIYIIFRKKINALIVKYREIVMYVLFGGLTTLVNFIVYYPLVNLPGMQDQREWWVPVVNVIAWCAAVAFAYIANKLWVFQSKAKDGKTLLREIVSFVGSRLFSLIVEEGIIIVFVSWLKFDKNVIKLIAAVFVVIMNYFFGKFLVFRKKKEETPDEKDK